MACADAKSAIASAGTALRSVASWMDNEAISQTGLGDGSSASKRRAL
jgi:hypothetical protein